MDPVTAGRAFMGMSLGFHIAIALFGVGVPLLLSLAELIGIARKDDDFVRMARRWTFAAAALFVSGAISGTVVAVTFAVLLSPFMAIASKVIILPFSIESFAFFIEAIFLGIYAYTWDRFRPWLHWLASLPLVIASCASAFLITTVNAFMSTPQGFTYTNGVVGNVNQWVAMWNPAVPTRTGHSIIAYYATTAFVFAALAAGRLLRKKNLVPRQKIYYEKALGFTLLLGLLFSLVVVITGDQSARFIAQVEPEKFAAAESVFVSGGNQPLMIGTVALPSALSILMGGSAQTIIKGLDAFDPSTWPPLIVHDFFDIMAVIGILMALVPIAFFAARKWWRRGAESRAMLWSILVTGILAMVAVECGWMLTELGRQPWTIDGVLLTKDAFTASPAVLAYAFIFPVFYAILAAVTIWVLVAHYRKEQ